MKKKYSTKFSTFSLIITLFLLVTQVSISQTTYTIDDPEKLEDQTYVPGDVIILANGVYDSDDRIDFIGDGTEDNPITFRAETPGGVVFTGGLKMNIGGDYVIVDGFHWKGGYGASNFIQFRNGYDYANHSTIQNCAIDGLGVEPSEWAEDLADGQITKHRWIVLYGTYNTVINCSFMNKNTAGALILAEYAYNAFPNVPDGEPEINNSCELVGHTISNNYFYKFAKMDPTLSNAGDSETIRIGTSEYQNVNSGATVSNNYFVEADGENEIITNKSKNNSYINNTFRRSRGSLVLRHGSRATVDGNYFLGENVDGTGGIRITDSYHNITNNYIQDCIAVESNAKWNNGITFIGGSDNADVDCNSTDVSNGYQKTTDINVSNNTIMNTNAPLYYNTDKGSTDPLGNITNNLIYFNAGNPNLSDVIMGEYNNLGTALTYTGNVYNGTSLGATNNGFTEDTGIIATANGEIYTFSGADGKGADMGVYEPTTDAMVGYGIGACFLDYSGSNITDGDCTIEIPESLTVGSLPTLDSVGDSYNVEVYANVSWTAVSNDSWITIDTNAGTGNETISVTVSSNTETSVRTGTVTFTQDPGGDDIVRTLTITQDGVPLTYGLTLINDGSENDNVVVYSVFHEEVTDSKNNIAIHSLDKDTSTQWSGNNEATEINAGTNVGEIIYDLGGSFDLQLVDYMSTNGKTYEFQIFVSSTTAEDEAFTNPFGANNLVCATENSEFTNFLLPSVAYGTKYVKIKGYGQPARPSSWNTIVEIEFYGAAEDSDDDDGDGVLNEDDLCPNTPTGEAVNADGCSNGQLDDDNDGVQNSDDTCPDTPAGEAVNSKGCSESQIDDDQDGIMNNVDQCPNTPTGEAVNADGCSNGQLDDDNDGVQNSDDTCPDTPAGEAVNSEGCSESQIDDDQDGIMNNVDLCPNTPAGEAVNANGCSDSQLDDDNDGVMNNIDQCNNTTAGAMVNEVGCFVLPANNFKIETIGETCPDKNNGKIIITAVENMNYAVTIDGNDYTFNSTLEVDNLAPKTYELCFSVDEETYVQCFNAIVEAGTTISGKIAVTSNKVNIDITKGSAPFNVYLNGEELFQTYNNSFSLDVLHGDLIQVKTNVNCEGVFSKQIDLFESITAYPNPTNGDLSINLPIESNKVIIELYNMQSQLISSKFYNVNYGKVAITLENMPTGIYLAKVLLDKPVTIKVVKE